MKQVIDTIAAPATAPGQSGVGIIRVSGPLSATIARAIVKTLPKPRYALHTPFYDLDDSIIDYGLAIFFPGPNSFTGEDVLELHAHGSPVVLDYLLRRINALGARVARPGEFSERAFLNDKLDLAQAEAIADLISASSEQAARSAVRSLQGEFSDKIKMLVEQVIRLRVYVEAAIDFPDEEIDFLADEKVASDLVTIEAALQTILVTAKQGALLREGMNVVIAGKPNAGKSSLLNALSGQQTAIVTDVPGTTRDVLRQHIVIDGLPLHIIDTAGIRESDDIVEQEGVRRAKQAMQDADCLVLVHDVNSDQPLLENDLIKQFAELRRLLVVHNKIDVQHEVPSLNNNQIYLSAKTGQGIDLLKQQLKKLIGFETHTEGCFIARSRHLLALEQANTHLDQAAIQLQKNAGECMAEELRYVQQELSTITGEFTSDDLLGEIFSNFCIGK